MRLPVWGGLWGGGVLLLMAVAGVLVAVGMGDAWTPDLTRLLQPPSWQAWLGTDDLGRDLLARVVLGVGTSVGIALAVLLVTAAVGIPLGLLAGWCGGKVDAGITLLTGMALSFPGLLLALALAAMLVLERFLHRHVGSDLQKEAPDWMEAKAQALIQGGDLSR